jgi:hypothetical protein
LTELFSIPFGWGVAAFVFLSAIAHFLIAGPLFGAYSRQLRQGRNDFRWIEYALSASWMIVLIAMLTGASDFAALLGLFGVNAAMILFGLIAERSGQPGGSGWQLPFWLGTLCGAVPWIIIAINLWAPGQDSSAPTFVYVIFVTIFVFFDSFAVNFTKQPGPLAQLPVRRDGLCGVVARGQVVAGLAGVRRGARLLIPTNQAVRERERVIVLALAP